MRRELLPDDSSPVGTVLGRLEGVRRSGSGWTAPCPAHDDRDPSLSVREGDDGRVLLNDFGGCEPEQVVAALGLSLRDLFVRRNGAISAPPSPKRLERSNGRLGPEGILAALGNPKTVGDGWEVDPCPACGSSRLHVGWGSDDRLIFDCDNAECSQAQIREALGVTLSDLLNVERPTEGVPCLFKTAREIAAETPQEPEWVARPWVARGAITELVGKVKVGKTSFALAMIRKVLDGEPFLGQPTIRTGVILLSEQSPASLRPALDRAGLSDRDDLLILTWSTVAGMAWPQVVELARAKARELGYGLLAVDTTGQFAGLAGDSENDSGAALGAMQPLQLGTAEDDLAVVELRHERKALGDVGDSGRGSSAFSGAADIVLSLRRAEGNVRQTIRTILALSRFEETPDTTVVELVNGEYVNLGTQQDVQRQEAGRALDAALPRTEGDALRLDDLVTAAGVKRTTLSEVLDERLRNGSVTRIGTGKRGDPYRYWQSFLPELPAVPAESNGRDGSGPALLSAGPMEEVPAERIAATVSDPTAVAADVVEELFE